MYLLVVFFSVHLFAYLRHAVKGGKRQIMNYQTFKTSDSWILGSAEQRVQTLQVMP